MKNEMIRTRVLQVCAVLLAVLEIVVFIQPLLSKDSNLLIRLTTGFSVIAQIYIAVYAVCGFRKKSAIFLKVFINFVMLSFFFSIVGMFSESGGKISVFPIIRQLVSFAVLVALSVNEGFKNVRFGRTKSIILCSVVLAEQVVGLILTLIHASGVFSGGNMLGSLIAISSFERIIIALSLFVAVYAKYENIKKVKAAQAEM